MHCEGDIKMVRGLEFGLEAGGERERERERMGFGEDIFS